MLGLRSTVLQIERIAFKQRAALPTSNLSICSSTASRRISTSPQSPSIQTVAASTKPEAVERQTPNGQLLNRQELSNSDLALLPLLASQGPHYATVHIHARPYLLTEGDTVRLPFRMPAVSPGDTLRLTCASSIGSRDYTLRGSPYVDERLFVCRAVVSAVEAEPMRFKEKTKRRNRKIKVAKSKHRYTELTISELKISATV